MAAPPTRVADPAAISWRGDDFPTWLSPMLVKELRQGIQSGMFAWTFIGLQVVMFLGTTAALMGRDGGLGDGAALFWVPVTLAVAVVIPLRGLGAVSAERAGNNLDLVRLTHLSARRIVAGKWLAIAAQSALLATAVLPHLVLRYFFGGVNVVRDLTAFGWMLAAALLVAAAAVAGSTRPVRERIGLVVLLFFVGNGLLQALVFMVGMGGGGPRVPPLVGGALVALYTVLLLEYAAAAIAPPAENHAASKRCLGLAIAAAWAAAAGLGGRDLFWIVAGSMILPLVAIAVEALCERPSTLASIHAPFARRGMAGRLAALVLVPGWASGLVFVSLAGAACVWAVVVHGSRFDPRNAGQAACVAVLAFAAVVFPLPAVMMVPQSRRRHAIYGVVQVVALFVLVVQAIAGPRSGLNPPLFPLAIFPLAAFFWALGAGSAARLTLGLSALVVTCIVYALVAAPWYRELAATFGRVAAAGGSRGKRAGASA